MKENEIKPFGSGVLVWEKVRGGGFTANGYGGAFIYSIYENEETHPSGDHKWTLSILNGNLFVEGCGCREVAQDIAEKHNETASKLAKFCDARFAEAIARVHELADERDLLQKKLAETEAKLTALPDDTERLTEERDEADRRAGAAERQNARLQDSCDRREAWLYDAKKARGYHPSISFDTVWAETCAIADRAAAPSAREERLVVALTNICGFQLYGNGTAQYTMQRIARAALNPNEESEIPAA